MTFDEAVTPLELERNVFDADETKILSTAFEKAWAYVQCDGNPSWRDASWRCSNFATTGLSREFRYSFAAQNSQKRIKSFADYQPKDLRPSVQPAA